MGNSGVGFDVRQHEGKISVYAEDPLTVKQAFELASQIMAAAIAAAADDKEPRNITMYDVLL